MLIFCLTHATKSSAEADADTMLRLFPRITQARVIEGQLGRRDCELGITIKTLESMGREKFLRKKEKSLRELLGLLPVDGGNLPVVVDYCRNRFLARNKTFAGRSANRRIR